MDDAAESELTREDLIHDLNNVFETITEAADLLSADRRWKTFAATLGRSVTRGKRLLGAIPDSTPYLAAIVEDAIQSVTDYCIAARKPRLRFVCEIALIRAARLGQRLGTGLSQSVLECRANYAEAGTNRYRSAAA